MPEPATAYVACDAGTARLGAARTRLRQGHQAALQAVLAAEGEALQHSVQSPELAEAVMAFVEKRPPDFSRF